MVNRRNWVDDDDVEGIEQIARRMRVILPNSYFRSTWDWVLIMLVLYNLVNIPIEICFGPEPTWRERALECSAGFFAGAEQQMSGFLRRFSSRVGGQPASPITMHAASLIVPRQPLGAD